MTVSRKKLKPAKEFSPEEKLHLAAEAVLDLKAVNPVVLDMRELTVITDYFVICHGTSNIHIRAIADHVMECFEAQRIRPLGKEGYQQAEWILLDYGGVVVHIFAAEQRDFYALERLWDDAPHTELTPVEERADERRPDRQ